MEEVRLIDANALETSYKQLSKALCGKENPDLDELLQTVRQLKSRLAQQGEEKNDPLTLEADRDAWKRKAEAAVKELNRIADCESCVNWKRSSLTDACLCCYKSGFVEGECNYTWRGPCEENGGAEDARNA